jgi:polyisoprenoid-binding protein YceI
MKGAIQSGMVFLLLAMGSQASAQQPVPGGTVREGMLSFDGKATAGDFVGSTKSVTGEITGAETLAGVRGWVEAQTGTLATGNDHRDRDMKQKSLETDKFPTMRFDLTGVIGGVESGDSIPVTLNGKLMIHGETREVRLPGTVVFRAGEVRIRSDFPLNVTDYKVGSLSRFLGMFKMNPDIVVHVDVTFASRTG